MFELIDNIVFLVFLLFSLSIGIYHFWKAQIGYAHIQARLDTDAVNNQFKASILPIFLSLLMTFTSTLNLQGVTQEIYNRGCSLLVYNLASPFSYWLFGKFFLPLFFRHREKLCGNFYKYFELRFGSTWLCQICTWIFFIGQIFLHAMVIFGPAIGFAAVTELNDKYLILAIGLVCTAYTAFGGFQTVLVTDSIQAMVMFIGLFIFIAKGTMGAGGIYHIFSFNQQRGSFISSFSFEYSLLQYNSFWIMLISGIFPGAIFVCFSQLAMQRYYALPSLTHARRTNFLMAIFMIISNLMMVFIGLMMLAYFNGENLVMANKVQSPDQIIIYFADKIFENLPGMLGLFLVIISSASLSTISSGLNAIMEVLYKEYVVHFCPYEPKLGKFLITSILGLLSTGLAFVGFLFPSILGATISLLSAFLGPTFGLFLLGALLPPRFANKYGAIVGFISATMFLLMCIISNLVQSQNPFTELFIYNGTLSNKDAWLQLNFGDPNSFPLARISMYMYTTIGTFLVILIGIPVSLTCSLLFGPLTKEEEMKMHKYSFHGMDEQEEGELESKNCIQMDEFMKIDG